MKDNVKGSETEDLPSPKFLSTLLESTETLDEFQSFSIFTDLCINLSPLHQSGSIHSKINPKSIELSFQQQKPSAFLPSPSKHLEPGDDLQYQSPEVLKGGQPSCKSDIWSLGVVLYEMLHGHPPFQGRSARLLVRSISQRGYSFSPSLSNSVKKLLCDLLTEDPSHRPNVKKVLQYQWVQDYFSPKLKKHWQVQHEDLGNGNIVDTVGMIVIVQFGHRETEFIENELVRNSMIVDENGNIFVDNLKKLKDQKESSKHLSVNQSKLKSAIRSAGSSRANSPTVRFDLNLKIFGDETVKSPTCRNNKPPKSPAKEEVKVSLKPRRESRQDYEGITLSPCQSPVVSRRLSAPRSRFLQNFRENHSKS
jgi:serine/threonine protein kinase